MFKKIETEIAVGIDLGTTNSCVAFYSNNGVEIIENKSTGLRTTPSCVSFTNNERLIGKSRNSENTVFEIKRIIGRSFDEVTVQEDIKRWPFTVIDEKNKPIVKVELKGETNKFHPEQISAMILSKMKETACLHLNHDKDKLLKAVITIPAYFNDSQRKATIDAAKIAGLEVLRIINEPTAAAIAYGFNKQKNFNKRVLVFDLGGGTFDVSIMKIENGSFEAIATGGDSHLGGSDFDNRLVDHLINVYRKKYDKDISNNKKALQKLKFQCEMAKKALSESVETSIEIDSFIDGEDFYETISRAVFEEINSDLFNRTIDVLDKTIKDSELKKEEIDEIILVGGSIRIPKIQNLIKSYFNGKTPFQNINPDEAVAYGAAIQARLLCRHIPYELSGLLIRDVTPLSLGVESYGYEMSTIIKRNHPIPCMVTENYTTTYHYQKSILFKVFEGERPLSKHNQFLGKFELDHIQKAMAGTPSIDVTFNIDSNGILHVTAKDNVTFSQNYIHIESKAGRLNQEEIEEMISSAKILDQEDKQHLEYIEAKNNLETLCYNNMYLIKKGLSDLDSDTANDILVEYQNVLDWLTDKSKEITLEQLKDKLAEFQLKKITINSDSD